MFKVAKDPYDHNNNIKISLMTNFIYQEQVFESHIAKGELMQLIKPQLYRMFKIPVSKEIVLSLFQLQSTSMRGILTNASLHRELKQVYCYVCSKEQFATVFRKVIVHDDNIDCPELEFMVYQDLTLSEVQDMYRYTKQCKFKSLSFYGYNPQNPDTVQREIPKDTLISSLGPQTRLKVVPNMVRILLFSGNIMIQKNKIQFTQFSKTARDLIKKIYPQYLQKTSIARVFYQYHGVSIPEQVSFCPLPKDQITICIQQFQSPVEVHVLLEETKQELGCSLLQKEDIYYKSTFEISEMVISNPQKYFNFRGLVDEYWEINEDSYYKKGNKITITVREEPLEIQGQILTASIHSDSNFVGFKTQLRAIFSQPQSQSQNVRLKATLLKMVRTGLD